MKRKRTTRRRRRPSRRRRAYTRTYGKRGRRGTNLRRKARKRITRRKGRGTRSLRRARRTIKYQRQYGSSAARAFMRRYKMRTNPGKAVIDSIKRAVPVVASIYGTRWLSQQAIPRIPGLDRLGGHVKPVGALLMLVGGAFLTKRVKFLSRWRNDILLGMGINVIDTALSTYMPASVKAQMGMLGDDENIYDRALGEYVQLGNADGMGEYVQLGNYVSEMGEYVQLGAEEELGMEEELGIEEELGLAGVEYGPASQIGTGIGSNWGPVDRPGGLTRRVPRRAFAAPVPSRSFVKQVPEAGPGFDKLSRLYTGVFAGGF